MNNLHTLAGSCPSSTLHFRVAVRAGGQTIDGTIHDLSRRGLLVRTSTPLAVGQAVQVFLFTLPHTALVLQGSVRWSEDHRGFGIMFGAMPAFAQEMLATLTTFSQAQSAA